MESIAIFLIKDSKGDILLTKKSLSQGGTQKNISVVKDGHEISPRIKSNPQIQPIPVIMLTTSSSENDIFKSYQNHANCFTTKPVKASNFLETVAAIEKFRTSIALLPKKN